MLRSTLTAVRFLSIYALIIAVVSITTTLAQAGSANVTGTVTDAQGAVVAGATVRLINEGKGFSRTVTTNASGQYTFSSVPADTYAVEVEATGFKKVLRSNVVALVDRTTEANATLELGNISEVVNVTGGELASIVNTQDASLGNNFTELQISQLPIEGRNVASLLSLQPGVTPGGFVAGSRSDQANITLDGVDVNNQQEGTAFTPVIRVTPDSIEEFRVTTSNPDATKGRSAGAQISMITKSGSNEFHGNLFEYHRNDYFNANDWFNNASNEPRPKLIRNLFGGSLGGPIVKDRLFFFYNYEGMREARGIPVTRLVPLPSLGRGELKYFDNTGVLRTITTAQINTFTAAGSGGTSIPVVDVNPNVVNFLAAAAARYPANTDLAGDGINTGGFRFNSSVPARENTHTARFDWNLTQDQRHTIMLRGNYQQDSQATARQFPDTPQTSTWSHPLGIAASHTWIINSRMTNRFSYGLTRLAFSNDGEIEENAITFRDIFTPFSYARAFSRVNPTHNFTNDFTWVAGDHTLQLGTNIRTIRNKRIGTAGNFHSAVANFGFYSGGGSSVTAIVNRYSQANFGTSVGSAWIRSAQSSLVALTGRLNQYTARQNYDLGGNPIDTPTVREYATEEYDFYVQDSWKVRPTLTLTLGLRYGYSTPVYETSGLETAPSIALDEYFARRVQAASVGGNYDAPITIELSGRKNDRPPMYEADTNNFQPRVAFAWSPNFQSGLGSFLFGRNGEGVLRGGFGVTNDYYGQQLAVSFDAANTLGFLQQWTTPANSFNLTTNPAPAWDGTNMNIRNFPGVDLPANLIYPLQQPRDLAMRIESSIDRGIQAPINYSVNLTYGRQLPKKLYLETSYIMRKARHLLARRDVMSANNLIDPISGMDYYTAARIIAEHAYSIGPWTPAGLNSVPTVPFFENLWPRLDPSMTNSQFFYDWGAGSTDWTFPQLIFDLFGPTNLFYQSQYGALDSFGSIGNSDYNAGTLSIRQRLSTLTWDFNYTYSHSMDDTSGLQTSAAYGTAFILNPIRQRDNYASSDFDMRHIINVNAIWQLPFGRGRQWLSNSNSAVNAILGGWQLTSIFRYNSGQPHGTGFKIFDNSGWATNWNLKSAMVQTRPIETGVFFNGEGGLPSMFADRDEAYRSFRSPFPGETGDRNQLRWPAFWTLDMALGKSFNMPWQENHKLGLTWAVFNVTNTPIFVGNSNTAMGYLPQNGSAPTGYGVFTETRGEARVMQFAIRYDF